MANVFLFVPNLIGYARIALLLLSLWLMPRSPLPAVCCYLGSALLDAFDGYAARLLNQCSRLGSVLDMLTDRCSTLCLLMQLSVLYPSYTLGLQLSAAIDIASHWVHMYSVNIRGSMSHKLIDRDGNRILHYYYSSRTVLFLMCAGNELFYLLLYVLYFTEGPTVVGLALGWVRLLVWFTAPVSVTKTLINLVQMVSAAQDVAQIDQRDGHEQLDSCRDKAK
ncbi:CDP-diacylglycerol--inositol 3-phosphatidyltransferase [Hypanus sabinus]|uniref:CDP-diacylglycerol--inositol 3-phosphatidyltransferase n=1 Tax=Hypanus sabinus TaxID=79690 RepID=UPI0028C3F301|nr:CDP-diacylglycerol--inositol 3-phosphatidyltransferase [Hypanus sabinus]